MNVMLAGFLGGWEVVVLLLLALLLFGAKKLPELAKGLGTGIKEFKKATREVTDEIQNAGNETSTPAPKGPPANTTAQSQSQPQPQPQPQPKVPETKVI
jgi:sec-independent protein translocase protein TatA